MIETRAARIRRNVDRQRLGDLLAAVGPQQHLQIDRRAGLRAAAVDPDALERRAARLFAGVDLEVEPFELDVLERVAQQEIDRRDDVGGRADRRLVAA